MKISSPKLAPASKAAERSQLATPKSGNAGLVPSAPSKREDNFQTQQVKPNATASASGSVSIAIPKGEAAPSGTASASGTASVGLPKTQSVSTYALPANLEPHRATFDRIGERIANMPSHVQEDAIVREGSRLSKEFEGIATPEEVDKSLRAAVAYFGRRTTTEDPQAFSMSMSADASVDTSRSQDTVNDTARDAGRPIAQDPSSQNPRNLPRSLRQPQQEQQQEETRQLFRRMPRWF